MGKPPEKPRVAGSDMARGMSQASWGLSVAFGFAGIVALCWLAGRVLDDWLGSEPVVQIIGTVVGWVLGVVVVYWAAQRDQQGGRQ